MALITLQIQDSVAPAIVSGDSFSQYLSRLDPYFRGVRGGTPFTTINYQAGGVAASQTYTFATGAGSCVAIINGTSVTITATGTDATDAAALAAAINANTTTNKLVVATAALAVCTVTALLPGFLGNCCTTTATGTNLTAGGTKMAGGTNSTPVTVQAYT